MSWGADEEVEMMMNCRGPVFNSIDALDNYFKKRLDLPGVVAS